LDNLDKLERQRAANRERQRRRQKQGSQEERDIQNKMSVKELLAK
jgi:hypothetical protein